MPSFKLRDQSALLIDLRALLVNGGQFDVANIGDGQRGFAQALDVVQVLVIRILCAVEQHLGQVGFRVTRLGPLVNLLLRVDAGEALRVLQVKHCQRNQGAAFAIGKGFFQQPFSFTVLSLRRVRARHQQPTQTSLGPWRGVGCRAISRFGQFELFRVMGFNLNISQADLSIAVARSANCR